MACDYSPQIGVVDFMISTFLVVAFLATAAQKKKKFTNEPYYQYYLSGLLFKLASVAVFLCIFIYYYRGGDTLAYHQGAVAMKNLFYQSPAQYFDLMFGSITFEKYFNYFNGETCYPPTWMIKKESNFTVIRIASLFQILLPNAILATNLIIARVAYASMFKLYVLFCTYFPGREKHLAWAFLFMPSVAFWGSGIMKDTIALAGICWFIVLFYQLLIQKIRFSVGKLLGLLLAMYAIYMVKTYLLLALLPGLVIWFNFQRISRIKSVFVRVFLFPIIFIGSVFGVLAFYISNSELFGVYGADSVLEEAAKVQQDLVREEAYGSNNFDIGRFDPTIAGVTAKIPAALVAGLFRPFITESGGSPTMVLAGIENLALIVLFIIALIRTRIIGFFSNIFSNPLLILAFVFSLLLAFSIGLTSANFGALVRYKVPLVPFFVTILLLGIKPAKTDK